MPGLLATRDRRFLAAMGDRLLATRLGAPVAARAALIAPEAVSSDAYLGALQALLPEGRAWTRAPDATLTRLLGAWSATLARVDARAVDLRAECSSRTVLEMLADWEAEFGLPDSCHASGSTIDRAAALRQRVVGRGRANTAADLIADAADLGYAITVEEHAPWRCGASSVAEPLRGAAWAYAFTVHAPATSITSEWTVGRSSVGDPLRSWGNRPLECLINRTKRATRIALFAYDA